MAEVCLRLAQRLTDFLTDHLQSGRLKAECTACTGTYARSRLFKAGRCGHRYCSKCLAAMFRLSLKDESAYPARCCPGDGPIDVKRCWSKFPLLGKTLREDLNDRKEEMETPAKVRLYCRNKHCAAFLPSSRIGITLGYAACRKCWMTTCAACGGSYHRLKRECPGKRGTEDEDDWETLQQVAAQNRWQQCSRCNMYVERIDGCRQMGKLNPLSFYSHRAPANLWYNI